MKVKLKETKKNKYGQYFTDPIVADFMIELADLNENSEILEPSCGEGVFLELFLNKGFKNLTAYEIDNTLAHKFDFVKYESFISAKIIQKFDLVIGNPPYIRWKNLEQDLKAELLKNEIWNKYFNALCDYLYIFILKSIELLKDNGQLIFICPEYWMNTTHSISLRNYMVQNGYFEEIYHFNETPIFDGVSVSIVIFKFIKSKQKNKEIKVAKYYSQQKLTNEILQKIKQRAHITDLEYLDVTQFKINERWILQPDGISQYDFDQQLIDGFNDILEGDPNYFDPIFDSDSMINVCSGEMIKDIYNSKGHDAQYPLAGLASDLGGEGIFKYDIFIASELFSEDHSFYYATLNSYTNKSVPEKFQLWEVIAHEFGHTIDYRTVYNYNFYNSDMRENSVVKALNNLRFLFNKPIELYK